MTRVLLGALVLSTACSSLPSAPPTAALPEPREVPKASGEKASGAAPAILVAHSEPGGDAPATSKDMVLVPAGPYWRGCDPKEHAFCKASEGPPRRIELDRFYIDKYEVTVAAYRRCIEAGSCDDKHLSGFEEPGGKWHPWIYCNWDKPGKDDHPINCVSWEQANTYCGWAGKRLPTEAEWEKAARGPNDRRLYPWGDEAVSCELAITNEEGVRTAKGCKTDSTFPVGSRPKGVTVYGAYDMVGNVWEWTADWNDPSYYASAPTENPPGPASGTEKVGKGGCWGSGNVFNSRIGARNSYKPSYRSNSRLGFRCAASDPATARTAAR